MVCYKKHQQRSSCSGKRDPAAYRKKKDLSTPTGLDQDYNYLKTIERHIDTASKDTSKRVALANHGSSRSHANAWRGDNKLQSYLIENRIEVERAPKGMQRQRDNKLRSSKVHRALWSVEWMTDTGARELQHDCSENSTLHGVFSISRMGKARKMLQLAGPAQPGTGSSRAAKKRKTEGNPTAAHNEQQVQAENLSDVGNAATTTSERSETHAPEITSPDILLEQSADRNEELPADAGLSTYFYLRRPGTSSTSTVLIPLTETASLTDCLRGQFIQEYPTIYVLPHSPNQLPDGYTLSAAYNDKHITKQAELEDKDHSVVPSKGLDETQKPAHMPEKLDADSILNMLKRDIRA
jgi:hypothetical protein